VADAYQEQVEEAAVGGLEEMTGAGSIVQNHLCPRGLGTRLIPFHPGTPAGSCQILVVRLHGLCALPLSPTVRARVFL
jgi:hypothetical protein